MQRAARPSSADSPTMCRLLGIVSSEPTDFSLVLTDAPRCLATLSQDHPDGWGVAVHNGAQWHVHRGTERASEDTRFYEVAAQARGHALVAHIRQKTVGPTRLENTHPFSLDGWVFAHNGTVNRTELLRAGASPARLAAVTGDTDSELLFAYLLTQLEACDALVVADEPSRVRATEALERAANELRTAEVGAFNFLLASEDVLFAHRFGRSMFVLERTPHDPVREKRELVPGASIMTRWTQRRQAFFVASEALTDEPWREIPDRTLLRIDRLPALSMRYGAPWSTERVA